ncbi:hypothetical protein D3C76_1618930 [compost metagenome]
MRSPPHTIIKSSAAILISVNGVSGLMGIARSLITSESFRLKVWVFIDPGWMRLAVTSTSRHWVKHVREKLSSNRNPTLDVFWGSIIWFMRCASYPAGNCHRKGSG